MMKRSNKRTLTRAILFRTGLILLALAILGGVLVSCAGGTVAPTLTLNKAEHAGGEYSEEFRRRDHPAAAGRRPERVRHDGGGL